MEEPKANVDLRSDLHKCAALDGPKPINGGHCGRHCSHYTWCPDCVDAKNGIPKRQVIYRTNSQGARLKGVWCGGETGDIEYEPEW